MPLLKKSRRKPTHAAAGAFHTSRRKQSTVSIVSPKFTAYHLLIHRSDIHGLGVYAGEDIPARSKVLEYAGERLNTRKALARLRKICGPRGSKHLSIFRLNQYWRIDGAVGGSGAELINHCCDPNLKTRIIGPRIFFFARLRIRKGEELTLDYKLNPKTYRIACHCGAPNCRGTINRK